MDMAKIDVIRRFKGVLLRSREEGNECRTKRAECGGFAKDFSYFSHIQKGPQIPDLGPSAFALATSSSSIDLIA